MSEPGALPSYGEPPVDEVAIAIQFAQLDPFSIVYGALYERLKEYLPKVEEHEPIAAKFETFSDAIQVGNLTAELFDKPPARRIWFVSEDGHSLLQIQPDRIVQNWRKRDGKGIYPRFSAVLNEFWKNLTIYDEVVKAQLGASVLPNQCEVSYFNNITLLEGESYSQAFARAFAWPHLDRFSTPLEGHALESEACSFNLAFRVTDGHSSEPRGRLIAVAQPSMNAETRERLIRLTMVFRGPPPAADWPSINDFLLLGREAIVKAFTDITTKECHALWEREI